MSRFTGPRLKVVRRLGPLPGLTRKQPKKQYPPGQHGNSRMRRKRSEYAIRLEEKQKLRYHYGVTEVQLVRSFSKARRAGGSTGANLLQLLEMRFDNIVYRMGLAPTIPAARQLVTHRHLRINGRIVNIPSYRCRAGDQIQVRDRARSRDLIATHMENFPLASLPSHLDFDQQTWSGQVREVAQRQDVGLEVDEQLVIEFYSR